MIPKSVKRFSDKIMRKQTVMRLAGASRSGRDLCTIRGAISISAAAGCVQPAATAVR
jgi:hypothetical protein